MHDALPENTYTCKQHNLIAHPGTWFAENVCVSGVRFHNEADLDRFVSEISGSFKLKVRRYKTNNNQSEGESLSTKEQWIRAVMITLEIMSLTRHQDTCLTNHIYTHTLTKNRLDRMPIWHAYNPPRQIQRRSIDVPSVERRNNSALDPCGTDGDRTALVCCANSL